MGPGQVGPMWPRKQARPSVQGQSERTPCPSGTEKGPRGRNLDFVGQSSQPHRWDRLQGLGCVWEQEYHSGRYSTETADPGGGSRDPDPCWTQVFSHIDVSHLHIQLTNIR